MRNIESYKPPKIPKKRVKKTTRTTKFGIKNNPKVIFHNLRYTAVSIILISCLIFSTYQIIKWRAENDFTDEQIRSIQAATTSLELQDNDKTTIIKNERPASDPYWNYVKIPVLDVDLSSSLNINPDTVGWLKVPGTNIDYPFVQTTNNDFYLSHSLNKSWSSAGWVFLDYRNNRTLADKNQILYAHGRVDGSMFGSLANVLSDDWQKQLNNHVVQISTPSYSSLWQVFSVYQLPVTNDYLSVNFPDEQSFQEFLDMITNRSTHNFDTTVSVSDRIITLSTCIGTNDRAVLHAKLIKLTEK